MGDHWYRGESYEVNVWGRKPIRIPGDRAQYFLGQKDVQPYETLYFPCRLHLTWFTIDGQSPRCNWYLEVRRQRSNGLPSHEVGRVHKFQFGDKVPQWITDALNKHRPRELVGV